MDYGVVPAYDLEDQLNVSRYLGDFSADLRRMRSLGRELLELGAICKDSCCGATPKGAPYVEEGGIPLLRGTNVKELGIVWDGVARFICEDTTKLGRRLVQDNDVLLSMSGNAGVVCFAGILPEPCSLSNTVMRISFDEQGQWDPRFVAFFLNSRFGQAQFERVQSGMAQKHVMPNTVRRVLVPDTAVEEQRKIAGRYEVLFERIHHVHSQVQSVFDGKACQLLEELDRVFKHHCDLPALPPELREIVFSLPTEDQQDRLDLLFNSPEHRMVLRALRNANLPLLRLGDLVEISRDRVEAAEIKHYLGLEQIESHTGRIKDYVACTDSEFGESIRVHPRRLLYSRLRPYLNKCAWVEDPPENTGCSGEVLVCRINEGIYPDHK